MFYIFYQSIKRTTVSTTYQTDRVSILGHWTEYVEIDTKHPVDCRAYTK